MQSISMPNLVVRRVKTEFPRVNLHRHDPNSTVSYIFPCSSILSIKHTLQVKATRMTSHTGVAWQRYMLVDASV